MALCPVCGVHYVSHPNAKCASCRQREDFRQEMHDLAEHATQRRALLDSIPSKKFRKLDKRIRKAIRRELGRDWKECPYPFAMGLSCNCDFCQRYWPMLEEAAAGR